MILIIGTKALSREEIEKARLFLKKIKPILATKQMSAFLDRAKRIENLIGVVQLCMKKK